MLKRLDISNYALIENVNLHLNPGFTAITGETGAGKSILLKALNLLLGERADTSALKQSEKKCVLEAEFNIEKLDLKRVFKENDLDFEVDCILRREFNTAGKSRAFINDTPVQLALLKTIGEHLVSVHTQHQTRQILTTEFQFEVLDHFAGIAEQVKTYRKAYRTYRQKVNELIEYQVKEKENRKEKDYLTFLLNELESANLENTDIEILKQKSGRLENAAKIQNGLSFAKSVFENESFAPSVGIKTLIETFDELKAYDPSFANIAARLWSIKIELDDIEAEVANADDGEQFTDEEAQLIREKLEQFNALSFKHNLTEIEQLVELQHSISEDLTKISNLEETIQALEAEIATLKKSIHSQANAISAERNKAITELCEQVKVRLTNLAMPAAELKINLNSTDQPTINGVDSIDFLFKTNSGGNFAPLKKVASGGELSRLMLSILSLLSEKKNLPTLIFDEIDTGVSGEVATKIAREFDVMGEKIQVISITHLPQVAGKAKTQLHVSKFAEAHKTSTSVHQLSGEDRINILAGMISGEEITAAAKQSAANLLSSH